MDAKLVWLLEKYYYRSQTHIGGSSSQTHEISDVYLTAKELHQLNLDEEALKETLEEQAIDEKARENKLSKNKLKMMNYFSYLGWYIHETIHYKVLDVSSYENNITDTTFKAVIQPDLTNLPEISRKQSYDYARNDCWNLVAMELHFLLCLKQMRLGLYL
nr:hypothetical protein [Tanacetum cinerariifolium]